MTATSHTPGPWIDRERQDSVPGRAVGPIGELAVAIACLNMRPDTEMKANARLIAAAPDLLDLAQNVGGFDDALLLSADLNVIRAAMREWRDQARAAISRATGAAQ